MFLVLSGRPFPGQGLLPLRAACEAGANAAHGAESAVRGVRYTADDDSTAGVAHYHIDTDRGPIRTPKLIVATGGLSIPKIGASDFGYGLARQFGLRIVEPRPALVPLTFDAPAWSPYAELAGLSLPVNIETGTKKSKAAFREDLLFTHRGLSGPAVLQISSYWQPGTPLRINLEQEEIPTHWYNVVADVVLDEDSHEVFRGDRRIDLAGTEYRLLRYFLLNPRRALTRAQILDHVWDYDFGGDARVLETYVSYLRKKLEAHGPRLVQTVRGVGYVLRDPLE